jgi:hypothetical protein
MMMAALPSLHAGDFETITRYAKLTGDVPLD